MKLLLVLLLVLILILSMDVDDTTVFDERVGIVRDRLGGRVGPRWRGGGLGRGFQESCKNVYACEYIYMYMFVCDRVEMANFGNERERERKIKNSTVQAENASAKVRDDMKSRHHDCYSSDGDAEKENVRGNNSNNEEELLVGPHIPCI